MLARLTPALLLVALVATATGAPPPIPKVDLTVTGGQHRGWQHRGWHQVTTGLDDVLAESGLPHASSRDWTGCMLNGPETVVRCGHRHWKTHW